MRRARVRRGVKRIGFRPIVRVSRVQDLGTPYKTKTVAGFLRGWGQQSFTTASAGQMHQLFENTGVTNYTTKFFEPVQPGGLVNIFDMDFWQRLISGNFRGFDQLSGNYGTFLPTYVKARFTFRPRITSEAWSQSGVGNHNLSNVYFFAWAGVNQYTIPYQDTSSGAITRAIFELPGFKRKSLMGLKQTYLAYLSNDAGTSQRRTSLMTGSPSITMGLNLRKLAGMNWANQAKFQNEMNHDSNNFTGPAWDMDYHQAMHIGVVVEDNEYNTGTLYVPQGIIGDVSISLKVYGIASNRRLKILA